MYGSCSPGPLYNRPVWDKSFFRMEIDWKGIDIGCFFFRKKPNFLIILCSMLFSLFCADRDETIGALGVSFLLSRTAGLDSVCKLVVSVRVRRHFGCDASRRMWVSSRRNYRPYKWSRISRRTASQKHASHTQSSYYPTVCFLTLD